MDHFEDNAVPETLAAARSTAPAKPGRVYLVGGGPGDPRLITLRGVECLRQADLVLYDGLVSPLILHHTHAKTVRTCRIDSPDGRRLDQDEINSRLIEAAQSGLTVVRLKGGDPLIFGRGLEEAQALRLAGIEFEIVPGITAATGAGAYTGIALTHRKFASAVAFVTGHEDPQKTQPLIDYQALAAFPGTLVFYMGLSQLERIAAELIQNGKRSSTPAAVISRATTARQQIVTAPLDQLAAAVQASGLRPPSLIVVGDCVGVRETAGWFELAPLFGLHIGIPRPYQQAVEAIDSVLACGAHPVLMPTIRISEPGDWSATDAIIDRLDDFGWIVFTSQNGVERWMQRIWERGLDVRAMGAAKLAAIGSSTAEALTRFQLRADLVPSEFRSEQLAAELVEQVQSERVLWVRASRGRDVLPDKLTAAGIEWEQAVVYEHQDVTELDVQAEQLLESGELHWIALTSPAIARSCAEQLADRADRYVADGLRLAAISPVTAEAARSAGLPVHAIAPVYTWNGLLQSIATTTQTLTKPPTP